MLRLLCPHCGKLIDTGIRKIGPERIQCRACREVCRTRYVEWAHMNQAEQKFYWIFDLGGEALLVAALVGWAAYSYPKQPRLVEWIIGVGLCAVAVTAIAKAVRIISSLRRCPTFEHPPTVRSRAPRWMLWCGIGLTASPIGCLALEPLLRYSLVPLSISLPLCLTGVYIWQKASLMGVAAYIDNDRCKVLSRSEHPDRR